jgi:hypothetical protein
MDYVWAILNSRPPHGIIVQHNQHSNVRVTTSVLCSRILLLLDRLRQEEDRIDGDVNKRDPSEPSDADAGLISVSRRAQFRATNSRCCCESTTGTVDLGLGYIPRRLPQVRCVSKCVSSEYSCVPINHTVLVLNCSGTDQEVENGHPLCPNCRPQSMDITAACVCQWGYSYY